MSDLNETDCVAQFTAIGLSQQKASETYKNVTVRKNLLNAIYEARRHANNEELSRNCGMLLYNLATKLKSQCEHHLPFLSKYVSTGELSNDVQLAGALDYLLCNPSEFVDVAKFEEASGVGVVVSPEEIEDAVEKVLEKNKQELLEQRYSFNLGKMMGDVRSKLKWTDGKAVRAEIDLQVLVLLGPKTEQDRQKAQKGSSGGKKSKSNTTKSKNIAASSTPAENVATSGAASKVSNVIDFASLGLHKPGENFKMDGYVVTPNTNKLLEVHLKQTGGKVFTRFPPEPNGILHIGHAKAININFGYAKMSGGNCCLRFDDTNPEKEEEKFFTAIQEMVEWLGYSPWKVTHSSDYFDTLHALAVRLIEKGHAYVCHQSAQDMKGFNTAQSPWRDRPISESLRLFQDMKRGKIDEGKATLRMKTILEEGKQDPVAYRIKFTPHHRTGDKWCIYPTYDYTHCLCDSIENISHSLCTKEFQSRRSSYYWLCNALDLYCPVQWEYGRLNMNYTVVSKRKIAKLIDMSIVRDWDDPRLYTLTALRRRGFPPEAINNFCALLGVTGAQMSVDPVMLDAVCRDVLNNTSPRCMVVLKPLKVTIQNLREGNVTTVNVPNFPNKPERGTHDVPLERIIYIEESDFRLEMEKSYKRLSPSQSVGLKYANSVITVNEVIKDSEGSVIELLVDMEPFTSDNKPKAFVHWVSQPILCQVKLYEKLFRHKNPEDPEQVPGGFVTDCNIDSLTVLSNVCADQSVAEAKVYEKFQFERQGYFGVDPDSTSSLIIFNRTVMLKEDPGKN